MSDFETEIHDIADRIARLVRDAYKRGEADALERVVRLARSGSSQPDAPPAPEERGAITDTLGEQRKRAPKGSVEALVTRALGNGAGKTPDEIKAQATTEHERMIAPSSIRAHLRTGEKHGRYVKKGGHWYLTSTPPSEREEAATPTGDRAASSLWPDQEEHH